MIKVFTPWNIDLILAFQTGTGRIPSSYAAVSLLQTKTSFFFKKRHCLHLFEEMGIGDQPHVDFFVFDSFIGHI